MSRQLQRDPFARATLVRYVAEAPHQKDCAWCGNGPPRYVYRWEGDTGRPESIERLRAFCSVGCWRSYYQ